MKPTENNPRELYGRAGENSHPVFFLGVKEECFVEIRPIIPVFNLETEANHSGFKEYASVVKPIYEFVKEFFDDAVGAQIWLSEVKDLIDLSVGTRGLKPVAFFSDIVPPNSIYSDHKGKIIFDQKSHNNIYFDKEYNVLIVRYLVYGRVDWTDSRLFVFGEQIEDIERWVEYLQSLRKELYQNSLNIYVDSPNGMKRDRQEKNFATSRDEVILEESFKVEIFRTIDAFFNDSEFYKKYRIPYRRGILLTGAPGNGKTTLVKSIANTLTAPVIYWQINEFSSSNSIQDVFEAAKIMAPCVLVIEDIDSLPQACRSTFLNTLDGINTGEGIFLIGTTNYPEKIDDALLNRAGRFDHTYTIGKPTAEMRRKYLLTKGIGDFAPTYIIDEIVHRMEGFSMASLNEVYTLAALQFHYDGKLDVVAIVNSLQEIQQKQKKGDWVDDKDKKSSMGFISRQETLTPRNDRPDSL